MAIGLLTCGALCRLGAQNPTATLVGTVADPTGAAVAGAKVEIRNTGTNQITKLQSNQRGEFIAPDLAPGIYDVNVSQDGFQTSREIGLELQVDQEARLEFHLQLGSRAETVEVTASVPLINTENGAKGDVVVADEIVEMPLNGRNFSDLALLIPGVLPNSQGGEGGASGMAINGARADNTNFLIDGFNDRNYRDSTAQARPNVDAMQEFKMETAGYSAEYGRQAGGVLNMVLKTGTNQVHGTLFEFLRNNITDARNFFSTVNPELRRNQYGSTVTGPVVLPKVYNGQNRTFFMFSWEGIRQNSGSSALAAVPTLAERQGNFAGLPPLKDPLAAGNCTATSTAACFPGNQIPVSRLSPIALAAGAYYPLPNLAGANNYDAYAVALSDSDAYIGKIDQRISNSDSLSFRLLKSNGSSTNPFNSGNTGLFGQVGWTATLLAGLTYTRTVSPTLINEARVSYTRTAEKYPHTHTGTDYLTKFGMPGGANADPDLTGFPLFKITGYDALGDNATLSQDTDNNYQAADTVTWVKGAHLFKFGGDALRFEARQPQTINFLGTYNFTGSFTNQPYGDFLLGYPNSTSKLLNVDINYVSANNYSFFAQDDWKIASRLTLNFGLRYELPMPMSDKYGRWASFVPQFDKLVVGSLAGAVPGTSFTNASQVETAQQAGIPSSLVFPNYKKFAPRFGFAWRPFGGNRTVLRGGYGIFYGALEQDIQISNALGNVFPFGISETVNAKAATPNYLTLANPFPVGPTLSESDITVNGYQLHAPSPYAQNYNLTVEREIGDSAIEIGYAGSKGTHLGKNYNLNQPYDRSAALPNGISPYPAWSTITYYSFYVNSIYNAGTVTFRRRFNHGFFYRVSYVYAKSIDDGSQINGAPTGGYTGVQNSLDLRAERGRSDFDIGHSFTTSFSWVAPFGHNLLARGWQLTGTGSARTGIPFTPQLNNVNLTLGQANRPNRIAKGTVANPTAADWFDVSAFPALPNGTFGYGNSGRNILDGPGSIAINLGLYRNFSVREKGKVQFRWEVYNVLNHPNFTLPVVFVNAPNAATIASAGSPRVMQFGLRYFF